MLNQQPERGNKTRSELAIEKKDEILWFDHYNETFFNIFAKWTLWFGGLERFSYVIRIRVNMMFTVTHLNTCSSTCTRCNYTQSFHIKLLNSLSHTYFFYNVSVRAVVDATWRNGTEKRQLLGKKYMHFWWKKNSAARDWGALYLVEFITYCGWNFIPVWDESIEPCSQYASSCPGEIKEIRDKINSTIR